MPDFLSILVQASHNLLWIVIKGGMIMIPLLISSIIALIARVPGAGIVCKHVALGAAMQATAQAELSQA